MAWYKPARNRHHPGDPPPKWAPIGRAGRLALVITIIAGVVIALVIMTTRTAEATEDTDVATAGPDSVPSSWGSGQRVEVPDAELAMTFPEDWVIEFVEEGSERDFIILTGPERFGPEVEVQPILVAEGPDMQRRDTSTFCTLVRYAPIDVTADEFLREVFGQADDLVVDEQANDLVVERLDERLSRVLVNPFISSRIMVDAPEAIYVDHFAIGSDSVVAVLMCYGVASHRDDWLAIAESYESLPGS